MILEATGSSDYKRIVDANGALRAMCVRYTNNKWAVHDKDTDQKLCGPIHSTETKAMRWFQGQVT